MYLNMKLTDDGNNNFILSKSFPQKGDPVRVVLESTGNWYTGYYVGPEKDGDHTVRIFYGNDWNLGGIGVMSKGVNINQLFRYVFATGAMLAGFAGMIIAPITEASIGMGSDVLLIAFVVIIIGGIGSIRGALIASLIVGLIDTMGRSFLDDLMKLVVSNQAAETSAPALSAMLVYILMAAILFFRPQGLFPPKTR